ncbi:MAG: hypothetical protein K2O06_15615 [Acetatifactor sp.]|nr:hypothetical protein [Acetatifactor sp.]
MGWDLPDVSIPDCVPEWFRAQFERDEREAELEWERREHYKKNQEKIKEACEKGCPILDYGGYDACLHCSDADHDTQTGFEDDFDSVICHHPECPEHEKHREEGQQHRKAFTTG